MRENGHASVPTPPRAARPGDDGSALSGLPRDGLPPEVFADLEDAAPEGEAGPDSDSGAPMPVSADLLVLHAQWSGDAGGKVHLWAEDGRKYASAAVQQPSHEDAAPLAHPLGTEVGTLWTVLRPLMAEGQGDAEAPVSTLTLRLPTWKGVVVPSPALAHAVGHVADESADGATRPVLRAVTVPTIAIDPADAPALMDALEDLAVAEPIAGTLRIELADSARFLSAATRFVRHLLAQQRFVPMLRQETTGALTGVWQTWLADEQTAARLGRLIAAMPPSFRAPADTFEHEPWAILDDLLLRMGDALCRRVLVGDTMSDAIDGRDPQADLHVSWLTGLLGSAEEIDARPGPRNDLIKGVRRWIGSLEERGSGTSWRLLLRVHEPIDVGALGSGKGGVVVGEGIDITAPGDKVLWSVTLHLQSVVDPEVVVDASDIWILPPGAASVEGHRIEAPQELLLSELGRAARLFKRLERVLESAEPTELDLTTSDAYRFLREVRPVLIEQGFGVTAPGWWDSPTVRLGAKLIVQSEDIDLSQPFGAGSGGTPGATTAHLGLSSLVNYRWQIAVGDTNLSLEQFEKLAAQHSPLIKLNGRWVEIRPEDVKAAMRFIRENPGGQMEVGRALRLAYASDARDTGVPILGMDATGWVNAVFGDAAANNKMPMIEAPEGFVGTLRAYQLKGLSWLAFLDRLGLGSCLADDMGLGKTVQLLALLAYERTLARKAAAAQGVSDTQNNGHPDPTLLVVPMSVVSNWLHEARRFTPDLRVLVHHGMGRHSGDNLVAQSRSSDMVITTYALAHRDREHLSRVPWARVVLDEAQNIKNPSAKQTRAIHAIPAPRRIALTGTPLENRLIELWSIMDFLNPSYLGPAGEFRSKFAVPIERYHDRHKGTQLRGLVQPFVLRRLKTDPSVITDLPEKVESKDYCYLTPEQATLYQTCVGDMLAAADRTEGIQRRGLVLAGLIKLKQICNHPAHFLKEFGPDGNAHTAPPIAAARSGKCQRLNEMLQEVVASGDKALVFTQFRQMGHLLAAMLRQTLDRDVLFLHGGTSAAQRHQMIAEFQGTATSPSRSTRGRAPGASGGSTSPVLILSLKAGGVGLNLTAANHVFHFDRWWNPAVETQATDRAYRIGQTRTVQVHKFVVSGTLEERIDQMIEEKTELADQIIGHGEQWLTELSTGQLRDLVMLRDDAVGDSEVETEEVAL